MATWFNQVYAYKWQITINSVIHVRIRTLTPPFLEREGRKLDGKVGKHMRKRRERQGVSTVCIM